MACVAWPTYRHVSMLHYIFHEPWKTLTSGVKDYGSTNASDNINIPRSTTTTTTTMTNCNDRYVTDPWNVMDASNYTIFILGVLFRIQNTILLADTEIRSDRRHQRGLMMLATVHTIVD